jgi:HD-like signal output (HDOD) protein
LNPQQVDVPSIETSSHIPDEILAIPSYVSELNGLLSSVPVDLKRVAEIIRSQPNLSASITHLSRLIMPGFSDRMASLEHGIVFLGTDQIRTLILSCCMAMDIGSCYSSEQLRSFWQHSVLTACLSERIARYVDYTGVENAYRAGLFHDAGALALVRWAVRTRGIKTVDNTLCGETIDAERERLGIDHGFVGKLLGHAWKLPGEIIDVLECHHHPQASKCDPVLVGIVAAADSFCVERGIRFQLVKEPAHLLPESSSYQALCRWLPGMGDDLGRKLKDLLEIAFLQKAIDFDHGYRSVFSDR